MLGLIFLLAGLTKLGVPAALTASINSYQMPLPGVLVQVMAVGLPPLELGIGIWLLIGLFTRFSAAVSGGLLVIFLIALIGAVVRGIAADCGCFAGGSGNPMGVAVIRALGPVGTFLSNEQADWGTVLRDVILLAMAVHLFLVPSIFSIDALRRRGQAGAADVGAAAEEGG